MAPKLLAQILIRLVSLYVLSKGFLMLPNIFLVLGRSGSGYPTDGLEFLITVASIIAPIIFGLALWLLTPAVAKLMVGELNPPPIQEKIVNSELYAIAISIAGLIIVVLTLPVLTYKCLQLIYDPNMFQFDQKKSRNHVIALCFCGIFQTTIGRDSDGWIKFLGKVAT